jgi:hypothetical protein
MGTLRRQRIEQQSAKLESIGRLFKGSPKIERTNQKGEKYLSVGKDLDHFRFEADDRLTYMPSATHASLYDELVERWKQMEQVTAGWRSVPILLPYRSLEENFFWRNAVYDRSGRTTRVCDGEVCSRYPLEVRNTDGSIRKAVIQGAIACSMKEFDAECPAGCKAEAKLSMIIPALYPGLVLITTKSLIDIQTIRANLLGYQRFDLSKIPMRLCRSLRDASYTDEKGEFRKQEKWLLHVEIDPEFGHMALEAQKEQYRAELMSYQPVAVAALPAVSEPEFLLEEESKPAFVDLARLAAVQKLVGYDSADVWAVARKQKPSVDPDAMSESDFARLRDALYAGWGHKQKVFKSAKEAWESYQSLLGALDPSESDDEIFNAWNAEVEARKSANTSLVAEKEF